MTGSKVMIIVAGDTTQTTTASLPCKSYDTQNGFLLSSTQSKIAEDRCVPHTAVTGIAQRCPLTSQMVGLSF